MIKILHHTLITWIHEMKSIRSEDEKSNVVVNRTQSESNNLNRTDSKKTQQGLSQEQEKMMQGRNNTTSGLHSLLQQKAFNKANAEKILAGSAAAEYEGNMLVPRNGEQDHN